MKWTMMMIIQEWMLMRTVGPVVQVARKRRKKVEVPKRKRKLFMIVMRMRMNRFSDVLQYFNSF